MRVTTIFTLLLPCFVLASPIWRRDDDSSVTVPVLGIKSLASSVDVNYHEGVYDIFAVVDNGTADTFDPAYKKLSFPISNGKLSVLDGSGTIIGNVNPSGNSFTLQLNSNWANDPAKGPEPQITPTHPPSNLLQKRASFGRYFQGAGKAGGRMGAVMDLNKAISYWSWETFVRPRLEREKEEEERQRNATSQRRSDDSDAQIFLPVFIQGPGVTFEGALGLDRVEYLGSAIKSVAEGDLFIDIDNVASFTNCELCLLPISGV